VAVSNQQAESPNSFSYDRPRVGAMQPLNLPASGDGVFTLFGSDFGIFDMSFVVNITRYLGHTVEWTSDTAVIARVPSGLGRSLKLVVSSAGLNNEGPQLFSFDTPVMGILSNYSFPTLGAVDVSIFGSNFASQDLSPRIMFGKTLSARVTWVSDSSIVARVMPGAGASLPAAVSILGIRSSAPFGMSYAPPILSSVSPSNAPTDGPYMLTISGTAFGTVDYCPRIRVGSTVCSAVGWVSDSVVTCEILPGQGTKLGLSVTVESQSGDLVGSFSYDSVDQNPFLSIVVNATVFPTAIILAGALIALHIHFRRRQEAIRLAALRRRPMTEVGSF
jgi:hypothetical protein